MSAEPLLRIRGLRTYFHTERGRLPAVDGVSLDVGKGEIVGIVGESGCGKSATAQSVLRLFDEKRLASYEGEIDYDGTDLLRLSQKQMRDIRGNEISMIFQDPLSSLNPVHTVGQQIVETLRLHRPIGKKEAAARAIELLRMTGIPAPERRAREYPHQLSGGMRQRVMIAIALACEPKLLIADEPTTALDVTIQAQILELIAGLNRRLGMSVMLITHDLGVVAEACTRVVVMYLGQVVESADVRTLFAKPLHPYTIGLMRSVPRLDGDRTQELPAVPGSVPTLGQVPPGCRFASRCAYADDRCRAEMPELETLPGTDTQVRCWYAGQIAEGRLADANRER
ncbi:ABC transporter ATP-binding protein [Cohnella sp. GCM10012308]|uniref:ABC transporter ATP-binding protein n=1 Tax=Cohnella sp. GCM10012308 TaxID=3317329 RepID=UPI003615874B